MNSIKVFNVYNLIQPLKMSYSEPSPFKLLCINGFEGFKCCLILELLADNYPLDSSKPVPWTDKDITACVENPNKKPGTKEVLEAIQNLARWANAKKSVNHKLLKAYKEELDKYLDYVEYHAFQTKCEMTGESDVFLPLGVSVRLFPDHHR